jgi:hypothetical protein
MALQGIPEYLATLREALPRLQRVIQDPACRECVF